MVRTLIGSFAAMSFMLAPAGASADTCSYLNTKTDGFSEGRCRVASTADGYAITLPSVRKAIVIKHGPHQGQFHRWKLNGRNATFYELDRGSFCGTTDDLAENICFSTFD